MENQTEKNHCTRENHKVLAQKPLSADRPSRQLSLIIAIKTFNGLLFAQSNYNQLARKLQFGQSEKWLLKSLPKIILKPR